MADVRMRHLPDWLVEWHRKRAESEGVSLEQRLRRVLHEDRMRHRQQVLRRLDALCAEIECETRILPDSTPLIREARQEMEERFEVHPRRRRGRQVAGARTRAG